jgi:hypothetical protein
MRIVSLFVIGLASAIEIPENAPCMPGWTPHDGKCFPANHPDIPLPLSCSAEANLYGFHVDGKKVCCIKCDEPYSNSCVKPLEHQVGIVTSTKKISVAELCTLTKDDPETDCNVDPVNSCAKFTKNFQTCPLDKITWDDGTGKFVREKPDDCWSSEPPESSSNVLHPVGAVLYFLLITLQGLR